MRNKAKHKKNIEYWITICTWKLSIKNRTSTKKFIWYLNQKNKAMITVNVSEIKILKIYLNHIGVVISDYPDC